MFVIIKNCFVESKITNDNKSAEDNTPADVSLLFNKDVVKEIDDSNNKHWY